MLVRQVEEARPHEQRDAEIGEGVDAEPEAVGDARDRQRIAVDQEERVVDVADRPGHHPQAEHQPCHALLPVRAGAERGDGGADEDDRVVDPLLEQAVEPVPAPVQLRMARVAEEEQPCHAQQAVRDGVLGGTADGGGMRHGRSHTGRPGASGRASAPAGAHAS
jgi:hypothetical protein